MTVEDCLVDNRDYYREIYNDFELTIRQNLKSSFQKEFHNDIDEQRDENFKRIMVNDITEKLACSAESVIMVIEEIKLSDYLK